PPVDLSSGIQLGFDQATFTSVVSTVGTKTLPVKITIPLFRDYLLTYKDEFQQTVDVPVTVQLGNLLDFKAYSYHQVMYLTSDWISSPNTFEIKALLADPVHPGTIVHQRTPNAYYSIGFLSGQNGLSLNSIFDWNVNIIGTTTTSAGAVNAVGTHTFNKSDTNIIKVYHKDTINFPNTFDVITNGKIQNVISAVSPALINNTTFFEMTADGYKLLTLNQLTPKNGQSIFKNASHAYLDAHAKEFIDIDRYPDLTVAWSEYPDTSTEGAKPGKLLVTQKSSTGKDL
ncbi:hypothetical protein, partial [Enterococcus faecalis]|uniref:hypothetical protein n=1 Tax=Enterococcus faecalis TaxID=1351 RepID=UPI002FBDF99B